MSSPAERLGADAVGVAADALAAPARRRPGTIRSPRRLVPVGGDAADDGVVLGVAARVDLAVRAARRRTCRRRGRRASIDSSTTSAWRAIGLRSWWAFSHCIASDGRTIDGRRLGELDRQRLDDLDLRRRQAGQHARQLVERLGTRLHADAFAALAVVVELERVVLRGRAPRGWARAGRARPPSGRGLCASGSRGARMPPARDRGGRGLPRRVHPSSALDPAATRRGAAS